MSTNRWMTVLMAFAAASTFAMPAHAGPGTKIQRPSIARAPVTKSPTPKSVGSKAKTIKASKPLKVAATGAKPAKTAHGGPNKPTKAAGSTSPHGPNSTTPSLAGTWTPSNPVAQKLSTKANLLSKVTRSLPPLTDLNAATAGFKNFGQFVAAVNVSNNLGIPFGDLKAAMTGTTLAGTATGTPTLSLGQAIQQLKPGVNADTEAQKAQTLANRELIASPATTSTSARDTRKSHSR